MERALTSLFFTALLAALAPAAMAHPSVLGEHDWLHQVSGTTTDYVTTAALAGATLMLIVINVGQLAIRKDIRHLWYSLYLLLFSAACLVIWGESLPSPPSLFDGTCRTTLIMLSLIAQFYFIYRFAPIPAGIVLWRRLMTGTNLVFLCFSVGITVAHQQFALDTYDATRTLFFGWTLLMIAHLILLTRLQVPKASYLLTAKLVVMGLVSIMWLSLSSHSKSASPLFWGLLASLIAEGMIITYALIIDNIDSASVRLRRHYHRSQQIKLKRQYNATLKRVDNELRTPLSGIVGIAELLLDTTLNRTQRDQIRTMRRAAESLLKWLNRLNDWRALQIGRLAFDTVPFDFSHVLNTLLEDVRVKAEDRKVDLTYVAREHTPTLIKGDPARIKQILSGTLEMALFYSEQGHIRLDLRPLGERNRWRLEIRDDQSGLHPEDIEISLQANLESESYTLVQRNWLIAKALAEHIGGSLTVTLNDGEALFACDLVLPRHSLLQHHEHQYDQLLADKRLLVVDDSSSSRKLVAKRAESWGMKVSCVPSGADALAMIDTLVKLGSEFDAMILDHDMPGMTGLELATHITSHPLLRHSPVLIMLSGASLPPSQEQARDVGICRVLTKPIGAKTLKITLAEELTLCGLKRKREELGEAVGRVAQKATVAAPGRLGSEAPYINPESINTD
jgi:CheY-like chemotaxis protein/signal transduction histidine kinase